MRPNGYRLGIFFGIPVYLHLSWFFGMAMMVPLFANGLFADPLPGMGGGVYLLSLLFMLLIYGSVLAHEFGHALTARGGFGLRVHSISLYLIGGAAAIRDDVKRPAAEFWIALAGPVVSVLLGFVFLSLGFWRAPELWELFYYGVRPDAISPTSLLLWLLGGANIALGIVNLMPVFPLDGGRVLRAMLWGATGSILRATRWVATISRVMAFALAGFGVGSAFAGDFIGAIWAIVFAMFLLGMIRQALLSVEIREGLRDVTARQLMTAPNVALASNLSLDAAAAQFLEADQQVLPVVDFNEEFVGLVSVADLGRVPREGWSATTLRALLMEQPAAMRGMLSNLHVGPGAEGLEIYARVAAHPLGRLPVLESKRLIGIITRERLTSVMRERGV